MSLAPSQPDSRMELSHMSVKRQMKTTEKYRPYDVDHHSKSKVAAARVHSSSNKKSPGPIAQLGGDSLKYVQELTGRAGGEFRCTSGHLPGLDSLSSQPSSSNASDGLFAIWKRLSDARNPPPSFSDRIYDNSAGAWGATATFIICLRGKDRWESTFECSRCSAPFACLSLASC